MLRRGINLRSSSDLREPRKAREGKPVFAYRVMDLSWHFAISRRVNASPALT